MGLLDKVEKEPSMTLLQLFAKEPEKVLGYRVEKLVTLSGDGRLRDGSECSGQLNELFAKVTLQKLHIFINETLTQKFQSSGFVLQDLINEVGRRLHFEVANGRYQGVQNKPGHDGFWSSNELALVIEVKTTDAYRINLTKLATYAANVKASHGDGAKKFGILLVVGRQDTGDLEAQIRGSKYAWDIRVISTDALIELAGLCTAAIDESTLTALQSALLPVEYTRVDSLVSLLSKIAIDVERSAIAESVQLEGSGSTSQDVGLDSGDSIVGPTINTVEGVRARIVVSIRKGSNREPQQISRSIYQYSGGGTYVLSISKYYARADQQYWYALQEKWIDKLQAPNSFLCLGMIGKNFYFCIPGSIVSEFPNQLNEVQNQSYRSWNMGLLETKAGVVLTFPKSGKFLNLTKFKVEF